jgi:NAD(P)-dependent dehydrogenase (short-subunit alcohol dehydrogenase family)
LYLTACLTVRRIEHWVKIPMRHNVIVTGGADSVGRVIADRFQESGTRVHICDVRADAVSATLAANPGMTGAVANVGIPEEVQSVFEDAQSAFGDAFVLVNNVGIGGPRGALEDIIEQSWCETLDISLAGMFQFRKRVIPAMKRNRRGSIINFPRVRREPDCRCVRLMWCPAAVESLTLNAAHELGPFNVWCNATLRRIINNEQMRRIVHGIAEESGRTVDDVGSDYPLVTHEGAARRSRPDGPLPGVGRGVEECRRADRNERKSCMGVLRNLAQTS